MSKNYNYQNHFNISEAMQTHNTIMPGQKFTLLDYNLLCLVKSFYASGNDFYMSNDQLASLFFSCEKTVRTSINRLCSFGFLEKQNIDNNRLKGRYLIYKHENVERFINEMSFCGMPPDTTSR